MPCVPMAVHEDTDVGEIFVEFQDVGQVGHDFVALVLWRMVRRLEVVGHVHDLGESRSQVVLIEPRDVVFFHMCHDEVARVISCGSANWRDGDGAGVGARAVRLMMRSIGIYGLIGWYRMDRTLEAILPFMVEIVAQTNDLWHRSP